MNGILYTTSCVVNILYSYKHRKCRRVGMADEADSKSVVGNHVWVQVPSPAVLKIAETLVNSMIPAIFVF